GIGVNGFIMAEGKKMSKRLGNFITMRQALDKYGADVSRFALAYFGEGLDDADWREKEVEGIRRNLESFYQMMIKTNELKFDDKIYMIDKWLKSRINKTIIEVTSHFEKTETRSAVQKAFYQFLNDLDWYRRRRKGVGKTYRNALEIMLKLLTPVIPHIAEEIWEKWGNRTFISLSEWPKPNFEEIDETIEAREEYIKNLCNDIREILNVTGMMKANMITIFTAPKWMYKIFSEALKSKENLMKRVMKDPEIRRNGARAAKYVNTILKTQLPSKAWINIDEEKTLIEEKEFLEREFQCKINIVSAESSQHPKAKIAIPFKPGIYVE
ncbi:MAG TPA: leucine--tRNA ligase, partial [Thermoprotei archaeon]|nr:leucine--tRNA ligase [Thermoprotei archaeon]